MSVSQVNLYINRARDFSAAVLLMQYDPVYQQSAALLAIHSAISYSDALRVALGMISFTTRIIEERATHFGVSCKIVGWMIKQD